MKAPGIHAQVKRDFISLPFTLLSDCRFPHSFSPVVFLNSQVSLVALLWCPSSWSSATSTCSIRLSVTVPWMRSCPHWEGWMCPHSLPPVITFSFPAAARHLWLKFSLWSNHSSFSFLMSLITHSYTTFHQIMFFHLLQKTFFCNFFFQFTSITFKSEPMLQNVCKPSQCEQMSDI